MELRDYQKDGRDTRKLLDKSIFSRTWGNDAASESQINLIGRLLRETNRKIDCIDFKTLNMMNASIIIKKLTDDVRNAEGA